MNREHAPNKPDDAKARLMAQAEVPLRDEARAIADLVGEAKSPESVELVMGEVARLTSEAEAQGAEMEEAVDTVRIVDSIEASLKTPEMQKQMDARRRQDQERQRQLEAALLAKFLKGDRLLPGEKSELSNSPLIGHTEEERAKFREKLFSKRPQI